MQVKTKNLIVSALVVVLIGALWYRVVYSSMESKASKAKSAAQEANTTAANLRTALGSTSSKKTNVQDIPSATLRAALPADAAEASFLRSINALRIESGVALQSITPANPTPAGNISTVSVAVSVQGTEAQLQRYVSGLTDLKRVFIVDNLSITPNGSSAAPGSTPHVAGAGAIFTSDLLSAQISGRIFSQAAVVAAGTTGGAATTGTTGAGTTVTTPVAGAPAPTGASAPTGVQNN